MLWTRPGQTLRVNWYCYRAALSAARPMAKVATSLAADFRAAKVSCDCISSR
jgi:hypothetical protein